MKKLFVLILWTAALAPFIAQSQQQPGTLAGFLSGQGLVGVKLERRFGNHFFVPVSINNKRAALMIDTGAPVTIIDKNSAGTFGLKVENTTINVGRIFGKRWERYGLSLAKSIALGQLRGHQCASGAGRHIRHEPGRACRSHGNAYLGRQ
jgi:gag-polyprotein putative aspartyl protease